MNVFLRIKKGSKSNVGVLGYRATLGGLYKK